MMEPLPKPADLLPHAPPMVLLDEVVGWTDDTVRAAVAITPDTPFFQPGHGVPAHVGIEWMAQTCGLYAGLEAMRAGLPVRLGFLLGSRRYKAVRAWFVDGERLTITVRLIFRESGLAVFDCKISTSDTDVATARLTVYQPDEASTDNQGKQEG
ncbi:hotdog family protein [Telmatospirillum sp.]|uniref:hotdog family protein n=1 Tax=Telmatospirillum sp. TaxID=2079197 RepID=UPI002844D635|nr:hotdog family protein [Telmatospirillum sp.]MDR3439090.1 hotdog family protein [Telmatospirillum sp.]